MAVAAPTTYPRSHVLRWIIIEVIRWTVHVGAVVGVFFVGVSWPALLAFGVLYLIGATGVTLCYHRYFAHRSFKTSRWFQAVLAVWGATCLQRGPIWWAAVHRHHHAHSDKDGDWHSPRSGFWHAHMGWLASPRILSVDTDRVRDLVVYPELRWLETWYHVPSVAIIAALAWLGSYLETNYPNLGTNAWQMVVWGFFVKAFVVWQLSFAVNSLLHTWGSKRFDTGDNSRNGARWIGLVTLGDGYHNNHHRQPASARHGFFPGEIDLTYQLVRLLAFLGLVWDVKEVPEHVLAEGMAAD